MSYGGEWWIVARGVVSCGSAEWLWHCSSETSGSGISCGYFCWRRIGGGGGHSEVPDLEVGSMEADPASARPRSQAQQWSRKKIWACSPSPLRRQHRRRREGGLRQQKALHSTASAGGVMTSHIPPYLETSWIRLFSSFPWCLLLLQPRGSGESWGYLLHGLNQHHLTWLNVLLGDLCLNKIMMLVI